MANQNPLRYRGYFQDNETGFYYLQSRYYDPSIGRFINADQFASTGQDFLGCNMFAYCGNSPILRKDTNGDLYSRTELHNFILEDICQKDRNKTYKNTHMTYSIPYWKGKRYSLYGFCDLYDTKTHEIWEAKRYGGGFTCSKFHAKAQVNNYVSNGSFTKRDATELKVGGSISKIESDCFIKQDKDFEGSYVMWYWDAGDGVIFYDYCYVPSANEAFTVGICIAAGIAFAIGNVPFGTAIGGLAFA